VTHLSVSESKQAVAAPAPVAPVLHTTVVLLTLGVLAAGAVLRGQGSSHDLVGPAGRLPLYASILAMQFLLLWFVGRGLRRRDYSVRTLIDSSPWTVKRWVRYLVIAVVGWILWMIAGAGLGAFLRPTAAELNAVLQFLPHGGIEKLCWVGFSVGTNFCEEVLYRGYLMKQFAALTGSPAMALLLQAGVFALGHVSLGPAFMLSVTLLGLWLGILTLWQRSLVPAIIIHIAISVFGGLAVPQ